MPKPKNSYSGGSSRKRTSRSGGSGGSIGRILLSFTAGVAAAILGIVLYFYLGRPPVAVTDKPATWELLTEHVAVDRRVHAEAKSAPFAAGEDAFESAARIYRTQCAQCHGTPAQDSPLASSMAPRPQQFFTRDRKATAAKPVGELFWPTAFGIRRSGMPAYRRSLTNTQLWQLALLLHSADQDLPDPVRTLLTPTIPPTQPTGGNAAAHQ